MPVLFVIFLRKLASVIQQKKLEDYKTSVIKALIKYTPKLVMLGQSELFDSPENNNRFSVGPLDLAKIELIE